MIGRTSLLGLATRDIGMENLRPAVFQASITLSITALGFCDPEDGWGAGWTREADGKLDRSLVPVGVEP